MIPLPKPKFAETNVPIGKSIEDYRTEIINMQTHVLNDAIDRVSFREFKSTGTTMEFGKTLLKEATLTWPDMHSFWLFGKSELFIN